MRDRLHISKGLLQLLLFVPINNIDGRDEKSHVLCDGEARSCKSNRDAQSHA